MASAFFKRREQRTDSTLVTYLVLGLGNPGPEYADTPHNAGFIAADVLAEQLGCRYWKSQGGAQVCVAELEVPVQRATVPEGEEPTPAPASTKVRVVIAKPLDFMNRSGAAATNLSKKYGVKPDRVIVIHDDLDLPRGDVRCKQGGGHAGHNGLRSIHDRLGTDGYLRVRVGIGRPPGKMDPAKYVLAPWRKEALEDLRIASATSADATMHIIRHGIAAAMNLYNRAG